MTDKKGFFVSFEGGEGVGKTTQIKALNDYLVQNGCGVTTTREPGGCKAAEDIRDFIFKSDHAGKLSAETETLLMFAARQEHIQQVIAPTLDDAKIVLCDRYIDSTRVYQGLANDVDLHFIKSLEDNIVGDVKPDLTFLLDIDAQVAFDRVQSRGAESHYDKSDLAFYQKLREGFLRIAESEPDRYVLIDANRAPDDITQDIIDKLEEKLATHV